MTKDIYMSDERYLVTLKRFRGRVEKVALKYADSDTPGAKSATCSWGLCEDKKAAWPDQQDSLWPGQYMDRPKFSPKYRGVHQQCPIDRRTPEEADGNGCFFTCRIFNGNKTDVKATREVVIQWYDAAIVRAESRLALKGHPT